ncbi:MAG: S8 family serine peptidase [Thalassobaculum sp.]
MSRWSVAIVDSGVTDETEARHGASLFSYDYYARDGDTDGGRATSHGSLVAEAVELTNAHLERVDLQISSNSERALSSYAVNSALGDVGSLADSGWNIGAVNMSFGSTYSYWSSPFRSAIGLLHGQDIFSVAASGNGGTSRYLESPIYPARLPNVISVGSHDGEGNPSYFSRNTSGGVHLLADGEDVPGTGDNGTSFAAPQVAATVTTMQALVEGATGDRLNFAEVIDALQQGGLGPRSAVDPADNRTTYFLHDHGGSVDYVLARYVDPNFSGLEYIASYSDLEAVFGRDAGSARSHFITDGIWEGRTVAFDGLEYIASYADLRGVFGTDRTAAATHYLDAGRAEGRSVSFDADAYMVANPDVAAAFNGDPDSATIHYITAGAAEGRPTSGAATGTSTPAAVSESGTDFARDASTPGRVGVGQSATGTIGHIGDRDWFATELTAGETVVIQARGASSGGGTLYDPELFVYDSSGSFVAYDLDHGTGWDAYLAFTPSQSGTYFLEVDGYSRYTGSYTLSAASVSPSSLNDLLAGRDVSDRVASAFEEVEIAALADGMPSSDPFGLL